MQKKCREAEAIRADTRSVIVSREVMELAVFP